MTDWIERRLKFIFLTPAMIALIALTAFPNFPMAGAVERKARAISSVVRPPIMRRVSAARDSRGSRAAFCRVRHLSLAGALRTAL